MANEIQREIDKMVPPDPQFPRLSRVASVDPVNGELVQWALHHSHPLSPGFTIMRMYRRLTGVKIYSAKDDGSMGILNFLPREQVRLTEEVMTPPVLIQEIAACEAGVDDKEDDVDEPDEPESDEPDDGEDDDRDTPVPKEATAPTTSSGPAS